jgi:hypothetical protein
MKTEVMMKRELLGGLVRQRSQNGFFSATDMVNIGNRHRMANGKGLFNMAQWLKTEQTKEFISSLLAATGECPIIKSRGRDSTTWVHPYLFIDLALAISTELKYEVYKWLHDSLLKYRNESGDSFKKMAGALWITSNNKQKFREEIIDIANKIKKECGVESWESATENQLKLRDKIQEYLSVFSDIIRDRDILIKASIEKARGIINGEIHKP